MADNVANTGVDSAPLRTIRTAATICQIRRQPMKPRLATPAFLSRHLKASDCRVVIADDPHIDMGAMPSLETVLQQLGEETAVVDAMHNMRFLICKTAFDALMCDAQ